MTTTPSPELPNLDRDLIRDVFLRNGFTIKEGQTDLKPYVYAAAAELLALARRAQPEGEARPTDDKLWDETLRDRDTYHEWADKLADAIAIHFGVDIGEHSNANCPWHEALEAIRSAPPSAAVSKAWDRFERAVGKPEGEAPQADAAVMVPKFEGQFDSHQDWVNRAQRVLSVPDHKPKAICVDAKGRRCHIGADMRRASEEGAFPVRYFWECELTTPAATLSPLCGAQHAESGAAAAADERVDAIVTGLYRRFKEWSKRGFGPDDVTWCEVKADVIELIASGGAVLAAQSQGAQAADAYLTCLSVACSFDHDSRERHAAMDCVRAVQATQQAAAPGALDALPRAVGIGRDAEAPGGKGVQLFFERPLTDDELRALHELLSRPGKSGAANDPGAPGTPEAPSRDAILEEAAKAIEHDGDWCGGHGMPSVPSPSECAKKIRSLKRAAQLDGGQGEGEKA